MKLLEKVMNSETCNLAWHLPEKQCSPFDSKNRFRWQVWLSHAKSGCQIECKSWWRELLRSSLNKREIPHSPAVASHRVSRQLIDDMMKQVAWAQ